MNSTDHSPAGRRGPAATPDRAVVYSAAHVSGILLALAGMASLWAFLHSITFLDSMVTLPAATRFGGGWIANSLCTFGVFLATFLTARRFGPLIRRRNAFRMATGFVGAGLVVLVALSGWVSSPWITYLGNILVALGTAPLIIMWGELYQYLNPQREQLLVTVGAAVAAIALYLVEILLPAPLFLAVLVALPFGSIVCLAKAHALLEKSSDTWRAKRDRERGKSPLLLFICIAVFSIPYNYLRSTEQVQSIVSDLHAWPSVLAIAIVVVSVIGIAEHLAERRGVVIIPSFVLLLLSAALLAHLLAPAAYSSAAPSLLYAGYYLFLAMIYLSIGPIVATAEGNSTRLFAEAMLFNVAGLLLGSAIAGAETVLGAGHATLTVLCLTYALLIAGFMLLGSRSYSLFRINNFDEEEYSFEYLIPRPEASAARGAAAASAADADTGADGTASEEGAGVPTMLDAIVEQCETVSSRYRLSGREEEVLVELARGRTIASIAETLTVSENTIKAHTKSIYRKLGVHTREELLSCVEKVTL